MMMTKFWIANSMVMLTNYSNELPAKLAISTVLWFEFAALHVLWTSFTWILEFQHQRMLMTVARVIQSAAGTASHEADDSSEAQVRGTVSKLIDSAASVSWMRFARRLLRRHLLLTRRLNLRQMRKLIHNRHLRIFLVCESESTVLTASWESTAVVCNCECIGFSAYPSVIVRQSCSQ